MQIKKLVIVSVAKETYFKNKYYCLSSQSWQKHLHQKQIFNYSFYSSSYCFFVFLIQIDIGLVPKKLCVRQMQSCYKFEKCIYTNGLLLLVDTLVQGFCEEMILGVSLQFLIFLAQCIRVVFIVYHMQNLLGFLCHCQSAHIISCGDSFFPLNFVTKSAVSVQTNPF